MKSSNDENAREYIKDELRKTLRAIAAPAEQTLFMYPKGANILSEMILDFFGFADAYVENNLKLTTDFMMLFNKIKNLMIEIYQRSSILHQWSDACLEFEQLRPLAVELLAVLDKDHPGEGESADLSERR